MQSKVIFIMVFQEYAIRAFRCGAIDYLVKSLNFEEQIDITLQSFRKNELQDHLALRSQQIVEIVAIKDICYLEGDSGYTTVFLNGEKKIVIRKLLKEYEEILPSTSFLRTHQSYLVNTLYIGRYLPYKMED